MRTFVQSETDCACRVQLGGDGRTIIPNMNLSKWDDRAFLNLNVPKVGCRQVRDRGNELLLTAAGQAHRFRRLDAGRFEYDVILEERPRHPFLILKLHYPAGLQFYRQRMLSTGRRSGVVRSPFVEGSYAVYWREKNGRFKTGKFCHIYRPQLIDSAGNRCWGELDLQDSDLVIRLPEPWLKRAKFPVVVDPIIGTDSIGASTHDEFGNRLNYSMKVVVNPYLAVDDLLGQCTGYVYCDGYDVGGATPVLYGDTGGIPRQRQSEAENLIEIGGQSRWYSANFQIPTTIRAGESVWFGMAAGELFPCFDDGGELEVMAGWGGDPSPPPDNFIVSSTEERILSMYFSYTVPQHYQAIIFDTMWPYTTAGRSVGRRRNALSGPVGAITSGRRTHSSIRYVDNEARMEDSYRKEAAYIRRSAEAVGSEALACRSGAFARLVISETRLLDLILRSVRVVKRIVAALRVWDYLTNRRVVTVETMTLHSRVTSELMVESRI